MEGKKVKLKKLLPLVLHLNYSEFPKTRHPKSGHSYLFVLSSIVSYVMIFFCITQTIWLMRVRFSTLGTIKYLKKQTQMTCTKTRQV